MISNAYKAVSKTDHQFSNPEALRMITSLNAQVNTKIEKLAKGDKQYNNPAPGYKEGSLFEVEYLDGSRLSFRRHNSSVNNRYAIKPYYKKEVMIDCRRNRSFTSGWLALSLGGSIKTIVL